MSLNDRKKTFPRDIFLTESISPIYPRFFVATLSEREGKTLGKTPEIVSRRQFRRPVGGPKVAEQACAGERDPYFGNIKGSEGIPHFVLEGGSVVTNTALAF